MLEFARWKFVVMFLVLLASAIYAMPNLYPSDPAVQVTPQKGAAPDEALVARVEGMLKAKNIPYKAVAIEDKSVIVRLLDNDRQTEAATELNDELNKTHSVAMNLASTVPAWLRSISAGWSTNWPAACRWAACAAAVVGSNTGPARPVCGARLPSRSCARSAAARSG